MVRNSLSSGCHFVELPVPPLDLTILSVALYSNGLRLVSNLLVTNS